MTRPMVTKDWCKGCGICIKMCKHGVLTMSEDMNERGVLYPVVSYPEKCKGCGLCEMYCPDIAIYIEKGAI